jgi:hypothetical protein
VDEADKPKRNNIFELYGAKGKERRLTQGDGSMTPGYYAIAVSLNDDIKGQEEWFRVHGEIEGQYTSIDMLRYMDVVRVYCPVPEIIAIMCEDCVYTVEGRNLDAIPFHIQDRTLRALYLFEPGRFPEPGEDEPVIFRMEREDIVA